MLIICVVSSMLGICRAPRLSGLAKGILTAHRISPQPQVGDKPSFRLSPFTS